MFWRKFLSKTLKVTMGILIFIVLGLTANFLGNSVSSAALLGILAIEAFVILMCFSNIGLRLEEVEHLENIEKYLKVINESMGNGPVTSGEMFDKVTAAVLNGIADKMSGNSSNTSSTHPAPPPAAGWVCPDCKNTNKSYAEFCAKCGAQKPKKESSGE